MVIIRSTKACRAQPITRRKNCKQEAKRWVSQHIQSPAKRKALTFYQHGHSHKQNLRILKVTEDVKLSQPRISKMIKDYGPRTLEYNRHNPETRGKKRKLSEMELNQVERTLDTHKDIKWMKWNEIPVRILEASWAIKSGKRSRMLWIQRGRDNLLLSEKMSFLQE
ncbi:MAG: hypothetical protein Q9164_000927 [Protoblastenia rupestris]